MARIELDHVGHTYDSGGGPAFRIDNLCLAWEDGSANALLGPSGCGKTTVLNAISGLLRPNGGRVLFDGRDVTAQGPRERHIAQVFQFPVVYDTMTVADNLAFPLVNRGVGRADVDRRVHEVAELLDLRDVLRTPSRVLTPAEKQIVSLGRGIVREDTAAVLLDEPLTVIDPKVKWHLRRKLREVQRATKLTMIYVTHDQHEALTFADKVTVMHDGDVVQTGSPQELHDSPATPFVGHFIGSPGMNLVSGRLAADGLECAGFMAPISGYRRSELGPAGTAYTIGIRPEHVEVSAQVRDGWMAGSVANEEFLGAYRVLTIMIGDMQLRARVDLATTIQEGSQVWVQFPEAQTRFYEGEHHLTAPVATERAG